MLQRFDAMESVFAPLIVRYVIPHLTDDAALSVIGVNAGSGQRVESLPVPPRDRYIPYDDELPAKPLGNMPVFSLFFAFVQLLLVYWAFLPVAPSKSLGDYLGNGTPERHLHAILNYPSAWIRGRYVYSSSSQPALLFISLFPAILIWSLEGHRRGNKGCPCSWYVVIWTNSQLFRILLTNHQATPFVVQFCGRSGTSSQNLSSVLLSRNPEFVEADICLDRRQSGACSGCKRHGHGNLRRLCCEPRPAPRNASKQSRVRLDLCDDYVAWSTSLHSCCFTNRRYDVPR